MESKKGAFQKPEIENYNANFRKVQSFLTDNKVENAKIEIRSVYLAEGAKNFSKTKQVAAFIRVPFENKARADSLREKLDRDFELGEFIELECALGKGDQFLEITNIDKLNGGTNLTLSHTPDTILLVNFWASWCAPALAFTSQYKGLLSKNEKSWEGKVKLATICMDEDSSKSLSKIKEKGWEGVDNYILPGSWEHHLPELYGFKGIPFVLLVNAQGRIEYAGHPSEIDIESEINRIIEQPKQGTLGGSKLDDKVHEENKNEVISTEKNQPLNSQIKEKGIPAKVYRALRDLIQKGSFDVIFDVQTFPGLHDLYIVLQHTKTFDQDFKLIEVARKELIIGGRAGSAEFARLNEKLTELTKGIPKEYIVNKIKTIPTVSITLGDVCSRCSKSIKEASQYFSYHDKLYFCKECGDEVDISKTGTQMLINPHALVYINLQKGLKPEEVFVDRIRDQSQPKTEEEEKTMKNHKGYYCNVCRKGIGEKTRYKCLNCLDVDICHVCLQEIEAKGLPIDKTFKNPRHNSKTHLLQKYIWIEEDPF